MFIQQFNENENYFLSAHFHMPSEHTGDNDRIKSQFDDHDVLFSSLLNTIKKEQCNKWHHHAQ
jgi:hypothetical protein